MTPHDKINKKATTHQTKNNSSIIELHFYLTFYLLDHFLQPKDKNTQHKLKISHLIFYSFSSLISSYFQSDIHSLLEAMEPKNWFVKGDKKKSEPHAFANPKNNLDIFFFSARISVGGGGTPIRFSKHSGLNYFLTNRETDALPSPLHNGFIQTKEANVPRTVIQTWDVRLHGPLKASTVMRTFGSTSNRTG